MQETYTEADILDRLARTCMRVRNGDSIDKAVSWEWIINGGPRLQLAFDLFLVRTGDELAQQPGTPEWRIKQRVQRMVAPFIQEPVGAEMPTYCNVECYLEGRGMASDGRPLPDPKRGVGHRGCGAGWGCECEACETARQAEG